MSDVTITMNFRARCVFVATLYVLLSGTSVAEAGQNPTPVGTGGNAERGRQIYYDQTCYGCHGFNGETGARDLVGTDSPVLASAEAFTRFLRLRADQAPLLPSTRMPNYPAETVSDQDARDLYAYIRTFELNSPDVEDVPVLRQILESAERPYSP